MRLSGLLLSFVRFLVERLPTRTEERRQLGVRNCQFSIAVASIAHHKTLLFLVFFLPLRGIGIGFFLSDGVFDSCNQLSSATKHLFQLCDGHSPFGPREVVVEGKDLLQACCVVSDLCCNTKVVRFDEFGETHSAKERCVVSLLVIRLHCESGLNL